MLGVTKPPDLDEVRRLVDAFMLAEGAGLCAADRAGLLTGIIDGRPAFTACVDWVGGRLHDGGPRDALALATALAAVTPPPVSEHAGHRRDRLAAQHEQHRGSGAYAHREDRLALDLAVAEALREARWPVAWEIPKHLLATSIATALQRLSRAGVDLGLGVVPRSPSILHRAHKLGAALVEATCACAVPPHPPGCARPEAHSLAGWDPSALALASFADRAVGGPYDDGSGGLTPTETPAGGRWRRR